MNVEEIIVIVVIVVIISLASYKIYKDKKNGVKCSGCPHSKECNTNEKCK